jgi:hypothetical protein
MRINKKSFFRFLLYLSVLGLISSCAPKPGADCGFAQNVYGQRISWKDKLPVALEISSAVPPELRSAIYRAAATWEKKIGQKAFKLIEENVQGAAEQNSTPGRDGKNGIYFLNNWESDKKSEQGRTSVYWAGDAIQEADIRINATEKFSYYNENTSQLFNAQTTSSSVGTVASKGYSFEALVLHEMGHFLGLKHQDKNGSVMAVFLKMQEDRIDPAAVDTENVRCEYE